MMVQYHVYLPPPQFDSLASGTKQPGLHFKILHGAIDLASQGSSLRARIPLHLGSASLRESQTGSLAEPERSRVTAKRVHDAIAVGPLEDLSHADDAPGSSKRRSTRKSTSQASTIAPLPTLPYPNDVTESFLSLNTTTSDLSQLPPSVENRADTSISNLPRWHIPLAKLSTLHSLLQTRPRRGRRRSDASTHDLVSVLVCVTAVEAPMVRQRKEEKATGRTGTLWISRWGVVAPPESSKSTMDVGSGEDEVGCDVKLWEECAREWGNGKVRRGDVVLLQGVSFKPASSKDKPHLVLSATKTHSPSVTVLYRTLPRYGGMEDYKPTARSRRTANISRGPMDPQEKLLRPDLRLGRSDAGIRKVAEVARWFAEWVGGEPP